MPGLTLSNEFISRDEALHTEFAILLYTKLHQKIDKSAIVKIIKEAVEIEKEFITQEQFKQTTLAPRSNCILSTDKIQSVFPIQDIKTALLKAITNLKYPLWISTATMPLLW